MKKLKLSAEDEKRILEYSVLVGECATIAQKMILRKLKKFSGEEKWFLYSRTVQMLYANHFCLSLKSTMDYLEEKQKVQDAEKE